jgi:hypothetical protein
MRDFTDVEKLQLQAKIEAGTVRTRFKTSNLSKYGFLAFILCLLVCDVILLLMQRNLGYHQYGGLVVVLMLLFDHITSHFTKTGWPDRVMKTIQLIWSVFGSAYMVWLLYVTFVA